MSKGIAIRSILLLLVGVIVAGILIYLVYSATSGKALSAMECRVRLTNICTTCMNTGWDKGTTVPSEIITECKEYSEYFYWSDNTCCGGPGEGCGDTKGDCAHLMGTG